jgi:L-serine dehydratase
MRRPRGSLGATGAGDGTPGAVTLGLEGYATETMGPSVARARVDEIPGGRRMVVAGTHTMGFDNPVDIVVSLRAKEFHSNGMMLVSYDEAGAELSRRV